MEVMENALKIAHLGGEMDCVTALYAGVVGSTPAGKEWKFARFSLFHNPSQLEIEPICTQVQNLGAVE